MVKEDQSERKITLIEIKVPDILLPGLEGLVPDLRLRFFCGSGPFVSSGRERDRALGLHRDGNHLGLRPPHADHDVTLAEISNRDQCLDRWKWFHRVDGSTSGSLFRRRCYMWGAADQERTGSEKKE